MLGTKSRRRGPEGNQGLLLNPASARQPSPPPNLRIIVGNQLATECFRICGLHVSIVFTTRLSTLHTQANAGEGCGS